MAWGHVSAIWDPWDPNWTPQTTIFTPKMCLLSLAAVQEVVVHLAVLRESLPSWKAAKENRLILGVNIVVWGFNGGPQGPRWPIHGPMQRVRWVERNKGAFGSFVRVLLVLSLLESS